jgi:hypothetical protein
MTVTLPVTRRNAGVLLVNVTDPGVRLIREPAPAIAWPERKGQAPRAWNYLEWCLARSWYVAVGTYRVPECGIRLDYGRQGQLAGVLRWKDEAGLAAWREREWNIFTDRPRIIDMTAEAHRIAEEIASSAGMVPGTLYLELGAAPRLHHERRGDACLDLTPSQWENDQLLRPYGEAGFVRHQLEVGDHDAPFECFPLRGPKDAAPPRMDIGEPFVTFRAMRRSDGAFKLYQVVTWDLPPGTFYNLYGLDEGPTPGWLLPQREGVAPGPLSLTRPVDQPGVSVVEAVKDGATAILLSPTVPEFPEVRHP